MYVCMYFLEFKVTKNANACSNTQILHTQSGALVKAIKQLEGLELESNIGTDA